MSFPLTGTVTVRNPSATDLTLSGTGITLTPGEERVVSGLVASRYHGVLELVAVQEDAPFDGPRINVLCSFDPQDGYGVGSTYWARGLAKRGYDLAFNGYIGPPPAEVEKFNPDIAALMRQARQPVPDVGVVRTIPKFFSGLRSRVRFGWTMFEATRIPSDWVADCNRMDYLIVPTEAGKEVFEDSGVKPPVYVVPEPLDLDKYPFVKRDPTRPGPFTFLCVARMCTRKCPLELVECFKRAFPHENDVSLVVKTRDGQFGMGPLGIPDLGDKRITVVNDRITHESLIDLYHKADAAVFLSHGEGFYHGPVQAMATGLPTILPNHSGSAGFASTKHNWPTRLDPENPIVATDYYKGHLRCFEPLDWWQLDYDHVVEQMRDIYKNREKALARGERAAKWVRNKYGIDQTLDAFEKVVRPLL